MFSFCCCAAHDSLTRSYKKTAYPIKIPKIEKIITEIYHFPNTRIYNYDADLIGQPKMLEIRMRIINE